MKRVKCYGRMKAVHIDEKIKKVFSDDDDSLWNLSAGESNGQQNCKRTNKKNRDNKEENIHSPSPQLFAALSGSLNSDKETNIVKNHKNLPPKNKVKRKQVKPKVKKTVTEKKSVKQNKAKQITEKENVPNFILIEEYSLYVEKNWNNKIQENSKPLPKCSKHSCLTSTERSFEHLREFTCASNLSSNLIMPQDELMESDLLENASNTCEEQYHLDKNTETEPTDHEKCNDGPYNHLSDLNFVNIRSVKKLKFGNSLSNILCSLQNLPECLEEHTNSLRLHNELSHKKLQESLLGNIQVPDVNLVEETSSDHLNLDESAVILVNKYESDQPSLLKTCVEGRVKNPYDSNMPGLVCSHISEAKESKESNSDLEKESPSSKSRKIEEHNILSLDVQLSYSLDSGAPQSKSKGFIMNSTPVVKDGKFKKIFPSPDVSSINHLHLLSNTKSTIGSCAKKFKLVTSTPSVKTMKSFKERLPHFNISHISLAEKGNPSFATSIFHAESPMCNRSVSNLNKSRSLTVLYDVSKFINKPSQVESYQMPVSMDSSKSRTCIEKVASKVSSSLDLHKSMCIAKNLLELCDQESVVPIASVYDWSVTKIKKIGEGTYGEVFMLSKKKPSVIKIIPISLDDTNTWLNLESVYSEVKVSYCLSALRKNKFNKTSNFSKVNRVHFVKGCYPKQLINAWDTFSVAKSTYNIRPDCFDKDQLYVILDLEYGGKDMTCFEMKNATEAESILKQITISLAIAEETHLFEHRDLHLGNILIQKVKKKSISYILGGKPLSVPSHGVMVTIIDFTLSRVFDAGCVYFHNLADDESLFNQSGDLQFEIYRATREHLQNQWHDCALYSNVLWLTFLCVKMKEYKYANPTSKMHLKSLNNIGEFQKGLKQCQSALDSLKLCKLATVPTNSSIESLQMKKTKFVDRKSLQKSKTNLRN